MHRGVLLTGWLTAGVECARLSTGRSTCWRLAKLTCRSPTTQLRRKDVMPERVCPACLANDSEVVESVERADLIGSYCQRGIDVSTYLHGRSITLRHCNNCELGFFDPAYVGDGPFYEQLQMQDWYYRDDKPEYARAAMLVPEGSSVLEVGCGKGAFRA